MWTHLLAQSDVVGFWHKATFPEAIGATAAFGALGIVLLLAGFKLFDWLMPRIDIEKELAEKNLSVAIVTAAMLVSLALIVARTVG